MIDSLDKTLSFFRVSVTLQLFSSREMRMTTAEDEWSLDKVPRSNIKVFEKNWKNLRMSVMQVTCFFLSWAPYVIQQSW